MPVTVITPKQSKVANARGKRAKAIGAGALRSTAQSLALTNYLTTAAQTAKYKLFWDLMNTVQVHGYLQASMSVIGRSTIGAWWTIKPHEDYPDAPDLQRRKLKKFYTSPNREWNHIRDFQNFAWKLIIAAQYLKYF